MFSLVLKKLEEKVEKSRIAAKTHTHTLTHMRFRLRRKYTNNDKKK